MKKCPFFIQLSIISILVILGGCKKAENFKSHLLQDKAFICAFFRLDTNYFSSQEVEKNVYRFKSLKAYEYDGLKISLKGQVDFNKYKVTLDNSDLSNIFGVAHFTKLEKEFCERMYPYADENLLSEKVGVPAAKLKNTEIILKNSNDKGLNQALDWDELLRLNEMAKDIWDNETLQFGAERARTRYFQKEAIYAHELKEQVFMFLQSTEFANTNGKKLVNYLHPLLVQMMIEILAENFVTIDFIQIQEIAERMEKIKIDGYQGIDLMYLNDLYFNGRRATKVSDVPDFYYKKLYLVLNSIILLQTVSDKDCTEWGLRPELSRIYLQHTFETRRGPLGGKYHSFDNLLVNRNKSACGEVEKIQFYESKKLKAYGDLISTQYLWLNPSTLKRIVEIFGVSQF